MKRSIKSALLKPVKRLGIKIFNRLTQWSEADLPEFATEPKNLTVLPPRTIVDPGYMHIGDDVWLGPGATLLAITMLPDEPLLPPGMAPPFHQRFEPKIVIGNRVTSTGSLTIGAHKEITIEEDVMFATNVMLSDALHGYETPQTPYKYQPMTRIEPIVIKRGCWIGQNVVIMPGVVVGELSIVGANSVVTESIPARSIAVGAPARVIKTWDAARHVWTPVSSASRA